MFFFRLFLLDLDEVREFLLSLDVAVSFSLEVFPSSSSEASSVDAVLLSRDSSSSSFSLS